MPPFGCATVPALFKDEDFDQIIFKVADNNFRFCLGKYSLFKRYLFLSNIVFEILMVKSFVTFLVEMYQAMLLVKEEEKLSEV